MTETTTHTPKTMDETKELNCAQINLQHSANLMKYIADNRLDIICIQDPYIYQGRAGGIATQYKTFTAGEARNREAVIITNRKEDATLITQLSDEDNHTGDSKRRNHNYSSKHVLRQTKTTRTRPGQS